MTVAELNSLSQVPKIGATFRHILVATDFSEASRRALCEALVLSEENDSQLSIIHVLHPDRKHAALTSPPECDPDRIATQKKIELLLDELKPKRAVETILIKHGTVAEQVAYAIEERRVDLLVIGTRARDGVQKLTLGSVAEELLRQSRCPVITIGPAAEITVGPAAEHFRKILFATDFGNGSMNVLPLVLQLAKAHQAKLILLHMIPPIPATSASLAAYAPASAAADEVEEWEMSSRKRCLKQMKECLPVDLGLEQEPEYVVGTDFLAEGVLAAGARYKVDLIVMGSNAGKSARVAAHIPWSAIHEVVRDARCPVLTLRGKKD